MYIFLNVHNLEIYPEVLQRKWYDIWIAFKILQKKKKVVMMETETTPFIVTGNKELLAR